LGIFASIEAHCAVFAAEMRRNSDGSHWVGCHSTEAAETEWLELELLREELNG
jgi:hypothetical protein